MALASVNLNLLPATKPCDDADADGICDDVDDCVGEYDECGVCNGDGIADGALLNESAIDALVDGGAFTSVRGFKGEPQRDIKFTTTWVTAYDRQKEKLEDLRQKVEDGILSLRVADTVDIKQCL